MKNKIFSIIETKNDNSLLQFNNVIVNESYRKKWNIHQNDFICLMKNGELLRPVLYRIGGMNNPKLKTDKYFMLIKHKEAHYSKEIMKMSNSKNSRYLAGHWCILDNEGNELIEFSEFNHPYLMDNSCIYSVDKYYYNIITGECYGYAYESMTSNEYLFLDNSYHDDKSKRGILKINKIDGSYELFPKQ